MKQRSSQLTPFGNAVRERRESKNLSQEELADLCNIHRTYIGGVERGERNPTLRTMLKLAAALDTQLSTLILAMEKADSEKNRP